MASNPEPLTCTTCKKPESALPNPLQRCGKCRTSLYCSRECQKADWKTHKKSCGNNKASGHSGGAASGSGRHQPGPHFATFDMNAGRGFSTTSSNPFATDALQLDTLPEKEVFKRVIDSYRMRIEDEYKFQGQTYGLYNDDDPLKDFQRYLRKAEGRGGCLPAWWSEEKSRECQIYGVHDGGWSNLKAAVEKSDVQEHYGDPMMPLKLRVLAEKIVGRNVMSPGRM